MVDVSKRSTKTLVLGQELLMPVGVAPMGFQKMSHQEGEVAVAKAAQESGALFILSTYSTTSIEEVAEAAPDAIKWFQLYAQKDREVSVDLIRRAEAAGFKAIVLTVDVCVSGRRLVDIRSKFQHPNHLKMANFVGYTRAKSKVEEGAADRGLTEYLARSLDQSITWKDVEWLKSITSLPVVIKGILRPDDARRAIESGANGIIVSNHGGRQLDGVPATMDVVHSIVQAAKETDPDAEVYMDGGVRWGTDVFKALAMGAKMVMVGRPVLWGLAVNGQDGVAKVLDLLREELDNAMALSGCTEVHGINQDLVIKRNFAVTP